MGLRLRHTSLFLTYVLAPLCAISNFNYEQVNPRNFPAAMLLHGRLSFRKPVLPSPSGGLVHRAFPIGANAFSAGVSGKPCAKYQVLLRPKVGLGDAQVMVIEREPRTVIHVKRAKMFDPIGGFEVPSLSRKWIAGRFGVGLSPQNHPLKSAKNRGNKMGF